MLLCFTVLQTLMYAKAWLNYTLNCDTDTTQNLRGGIAVVTFAKGEVPASFLAATLIIYVMLLDSPVKVICKSVVKFVFITSVSAISKYLIRYFVIDP